MTVVIIVGASVLALAAYLLIGWRVAVRDIPNAWTRARRSWYGTTARQSVQAQTFALILFWPVLGPVRWMEHTIDENDPKAVQERLTAQERRTAELEAELDRALNEPTDL